MWRFYTRILLLCFSTFLFGKFLNEEQHADHTVEDEVTTDINLKLNAKNVSQISYHHPEQPNNRTGASYNNISHKGSFGEIKAGFINQPPIPKHWIVLETGSMNLYMYSAFWDDRSELQNGPLLRLIGIFSSSAPYKTLRDPPNFNAACYVTCDGNATVHRIEYNERVTVQIYIARTIGGRPYFRYVFACDIASSPCSRPRFASMQVAEVSHTFTKPLRLDTRNALVIEYPKERSSSEQMEFCTCGPILFNHVDRYRIIEWLETLKILSISKVVLYDHNSDEETQKVLRGYESQGFVDRVPLNGVPFPVGNDSMSEVAYTIGPVTLTDCMYRVMDQCQWVVVIDLDEIILPTHPMTYPQLFKRLAEIPQKRRTVGYKFTHADFILEPALTPDVDDAVPSHLAMLRHRTRFAAAGATTHPKSIINPRLCTALHFHVCRGFMPGVKIAWPVGPSLALDCHYRSRLCDGDDTTPSNCAELMDKERIVDDRMLAYKRKLISAVTEQIISLEMSVKRP